MHAHVARRIVGRDHGLLIRNEGERGRISNCLRSDITTELSVIPDLRMVSGLTTQVLPARSPGHQISDLGWTGSAFSLAGTVLLGLAKCVCFVR